MKVGIKTILYKLRYFFIPYLILITACLIIKLTYTREEIYFAVNARNWAWGDAIAQYITNIGDGMTTLALSAILLLYSYRKGLVLLGCYQDKIGYKKVS
jgi:hypothetical protein